MAAQLKGKIKDRYPLARARPIRAPSGAGNCVSEGMYIRSKISLQRATPRS